jgi:Tfp pilus assembly protein PilO
MSKLSKEKQTQLAMVALGTLVVLVGLYFAVVKSRQKELADTEKKTVATRQKVEQAEKTQKSAATLEADLETNSNQLKAIEDSMAQNDLYAWMITKINDFTRTENVSIPNIDREIKGDVGSIPNFPYQAATFTVRGTGYFHDIGKFVADFENAFPFFRLQNVEITPGVTPMGSTTTAETKEKLDFKLQIVALIKPITS